MKIIFYDAKPYDIESFERINQNFEFKIKYIKSHLTADNAILAQGYSVVCAFVNDIITAEIIDILQTAGVKLIALRSAGYNNIDLKAVFGKLHVVRVPAYSPYSVAEHTVALMLSLNRKTHRAYYRTRDNNFNINGLLGFDMYNKTAGIIGTGRIGQILIKILKGFGMNVLAYDLFPNQQAAQELGFKYTDLEDLYKNADIISLNCPLNKDTYHIVNSTSISKMKDNVMIINTGRGQLVDTKALVEGLKNKKVGSAGLDVYEEEAEYFFEDFSTEIVSDDTLARLLSFPNVLMTSHQAFFTVEAMQNIAETTLNNIKQFANKEQLTNEICYQCEQTPCRKKEQGKCF